MKPCRSIVIAVALVGLNLGVSNADAALSGRFYGGGPDVILGDYFTLPAVESFSATELRATIPVNNMSGPVQNPLFNSGTPASNPFFGTQAFQVDVQRIKVRFTWDASGAYTGLEVTTDLLAYDPLSPTGPFLSLAAKGGGTKTPPPKPNPDTISGGTGDDVIFGDYIVAFNPDQPWLEPNGAPSASYRFASGTFDFVVAVPEPVSCLSLVAPALLLQRSRRK
jgi:hypothetical protein